MTPDPHDHDPFARNPFSGDAIGSGRPLDPFDEPFGSSDLSRSGRRHHSGTPGLLAAMASSGLDQPLSPGHLRDRGVMRVAGPLLLAAGIISAIVGFGGFVDSMDDVGGGFSLDGGFGEEAITVPDGEDPDTYLQEYLDGRHPDAETSTGSSTDPGTSMALFAGGGLAMVVGFALTAGGYMGAANRYAVNENLPALRDVQRGPGGGPATAPTPGLT